jgi:hypothetical protein
MRNSAPLTVTDSRRRRRSRGVRVCLLWTPISQMTPWRSGTGSTVNHAGCGDRLGLQSGRKRSTGAAARCLVRQRICM